MNNDLYIQYGCGLSAPMEWRNFDASPTLRFERLPVIGQFYTKNDKRFPTNVEYGDIVKGLPVEINSCKGVYCSHILEHLSLIYLFYMAIREHNYIIFAIFVLLLQRPYVMSYGYSMFILLTILVITGSFFNSTDRRVYERNQYFSK